MDKDAEILRRLARLGLPEARTAPDTVAPRQAPATRYQESLWLLDELDPGGLQYLVPMSWRLRGEVDVARLRLAWRALTEEQEALRARFRTGSGSLVMDFTGPGPDLTVSSGDPDDPPATRPLDPAEGWVCRATLVGGGSRWRLDVVVHHTVFDDWSSGVLLRRLGALYGDPTAVAVPHPTFGQWVRRMARTTESHRERDVAFWSAAMAGADIDHGLTCHVAAPPPAGAAQAAVPLAPGEVDGLLRAVGDLDAGPSSVLLALWWSTLYRAGGHQDLCVGTPVSQRWGDGDHQAVGLCVNTVPLRVAFAHPPAFADVVRECHTALVDGIEHAALPFPDIVTAAGLPRTGARHQLFRAWFATVENRGDGENHENGSDGGIFEGVRTDPAPRTPSPPKFEIAMYATLGDRGWSLEIEAESAHFTEAFVGDLAARCAELARAVTRAPGTPLGAVPLVPPEKAGVLRGPRAARRAKRLEQLFGEQVERTPDSVALSSGGRDLSYAALDTASARLAHLLASRGVGAGSRVGIAMRRGAPQIAAVLATLRVGGAYVPLDRRNPPERLARVLDVARPDLLVTDSASRSLLPTAWTGDCLVVDELPSQGTAGLPAAAPDDDEQPAYLTFTSGSTGLPKGIEMPHRAVVNLVSWQFETYEDFRAGSTVLQHASLSFDVSAQEIFGALGSGARLLLIDEETQRDMAELADALTRERVHVLFMPAPALHQLAEYSVRRRADPAPLRTVISGSEQLVVTDDLRRWLARMPDARLFNEYGPSETHVATQYAYPGDRSDGDRSDGDHWVPVGLPVAQTHVVLLDRFGEPALRDSTGEVCVGGAGVAHGYVGQPAETAAAYVPDPFATRPGSRMYRTGDMARIEPGAGLVFLGRRDGQVKIRGFRIETNEVRLRLNSHPDVSDSFVRKFESDSGTAELAAYVVPRPGTSPRAADFRAHVLAGLPEYMCPRTFDLVPEIPLNVNRKVDLARLPVPDLAALTRDGERAGAAPRAGREEEVAKVFGSVLSVPGVGREDDFFALGGSSLLATRLVWQLEERFGIDFSMRLFYAEPTVAAVTRRIDLIKDRSEGAQSAAEAVDPAAVESKVAEILKRFR